MKSRSRTAIVRAGWYYLIVFALVFGGAMTRGENLLLVLAGMLAGPILLSRFLAVQALGRLAVGRRLPQGVCAGDLLMVEITLGNLRRRLGSWATVVEETIRCESSAGWSPAERTEARPSDAAVFFTYVPGGQSRKGVYRGRLNRRGKYSFGPLRLSTRFPFGLLQCTVQRGSTATLVVLPRLGRLTPSWVTRRQASFEGTDRRERHAGLEGDFYGVRPWQRGDSRRWIHWRTAARAGQLVVRQFEQPRSRDVAVVVDLWRPERFEARHLENVELAVSFAATVVADLCRKGGSDVHLVLADPEPTVTGGQASPILLQSLMERLALVEAQSADRAGELFATALGRIDPGTEIVLVGTRPWDPDDPSRGVAPGSGSPSGDRSQRWGRRKIRVVDTSNDELSNYFRWE